MCDHGRLNAYPHVNAPERIEKAWVKVGGFHEQVSWEEGARTAAEKLKRFKHDEVLFIGSGYAPVEDNFLFARFAKERFNQKNVRFIEPLPVTYRIVVPAQAGTHNTVALEISYGFPPARERRGGISNACGNSTCK